MSKVLAFFADGMEMVEGLTVVDMLRRAKIDVSIVSIKDDLVINSSHGVGIVCDETITEVNFDEADMIFLPGGKIGTDNLAGCKKLEEWILKYDEQGKKLAAVCAAPSVYGRLGLLDGKRATCYPGFEQYLKGANYTAGRVETDGNITTSKGMGTCIDLGGEIIRILIDENRSNEIKKQIMYI